jgi:hypothetical protein
MSLQRDSGTVGGGSLAELRAALARRDRDLAQAREREAATAEILHLISTSAGDLQPVFNVIAQSAMRLFDGQSATVTRVVDDMVHLASFTAGSEAGIRRCGESGSGWSGGWQQAARSERSRPGNDNGLSRGGPRGRRRRVGE